MNQASYPIISLSPDFVDSIHSIEKSVFIDPWTKESIVSEFAHGRFYGIVISGKLAAFAVLRFVMDEAELLRIAVTLEYRREGLAKSLMQQIFVEAANFNCTRIFLEVSTDNFAAMELYKNSGYSEISIRKCYYQNGKDALIMQKLL